MDCPDASTVCERLQQFGEPFDAAAASFHGEVGCLDSVFDRDIWLSAAGNINLGPGKAYLLGDANLDGTVDGADFVIWNNHKFTSNPHWCDGNFNGDTDVDGADFLVWSAFKFQSSDNSWRRVPSVQNANEELGRLKANSVIAVKMVDGVARESRGISPRRCWTAPLAKRQAAVAMRSEHRPAETQLLDRVWTNWGTTLD